MAAEILGGIDQLAKFLKVPRLSLRLWMQGKDGVPLDVFLKAVDVVIERKMDQLNEPRIGP